MMSLSLDEPRPIDSRGRASPPGEAASGEYSQLSLSRQTHRRIDRTILARTGLLFVPCILYRRGPRKLLKATISDIINHTQLFLFLVKIDQILPFFTK